MARRPTPAAAPGLDELRTRIGELQREIAHVEHAPACDGDIRDRLRAAADAAISRSPARMQLGPFADPIAAHAGRLDADSFSWGHLALALGPDVLAGMLAERVIAMRQGEPGLPLSERRARLAELRAELLDAEIAEERLVLQEIDAGRPIARRADVSGEALLRAWRDDPIDSPRDAA